MVIVDEGTERCLFCENDGVMEHRNSFPFDFCTPHVVPYQCNHFNLKYKQTGSA
jgi:hypothetical protein